MGGRIVGGGVGLEMSAILVRRKLKRLLCGNSELQNSLLTIMLKKIGSENFRNFASGESPHDVHLPQAVLRGYVALRKEEILKARRINGGHAVSVPAHGHPRREAGNLRRTIRVRKDR